MKKLLKFEFYKLSKQKSFYICSAVMLVMSLIGILLSKAIADGNPELPMGATSGKSAMLSAVSSSSFTMICGIFLALFVCSDYSEQTIKNIYSRGFSRGKVYIAKFTAGITATIIMFAVTLLFNLAAGSLIFGNGASPSGNYAGLILGQLITCIAYSSFVFAICLIVKKVGSSIALAILGPSLISALLSLADAFLKIENFKISGYWLEGLLGDLSSAATSTSRLTVCIILSIIYAVAFATAGYFINKKQDN